MTGTAAAGAPATAAVRAWLRRFTARDFRNIARVDLELPEEGMAVVGENGHGKTNLLEAVYYLQLLRSFRGARDQDLVRFGAPGFHLSADVADGRVRQVAVGFDRGGKRKKARVNGAEPLRLADAIGSFPAVIFSPHDATLVTGAPSERRRFLDVTLALTSRPYLAALQRYRTALAHRNAALRQLGPSQSGESDASVSVWEPALAENGALLWHARQDWVARHAEHFTELCAAIGERGTAQLSFVGAPARDDGMEEALLAALDRGRALDIRRGLTHAGPHRDDLELTIAGPDGPARELRTFGSAGQQRTGAIALRLLEAATLRAHAGCEPIILLDDPFAELDARRSGRILELLNSEGRGQTLLAVPRPSDIPGGLTRLERWRVTDGALSRFGT